MDSEKVTWLANQIFTAFPQEVTALKFYVLKCDCMYYQRIFENGGLDSQIGIYRNAEDGPCEICMLQNKNWRDRVLDESVAYNRKFRVEVNPRQVRS